MHARCEGGKDSSVNIAAAHRICNSRRHQRNSALSPEAFRALVQRRMAKGAWLGKTLRERAELAAIFWKT